MARLPASFVGRGRAVTDLTFAVGRSLLGPAPAPTRAVNVAVHLLMALVAFGLCLEVLGRAGLHRPWLALAAAALWTLHPLCSGAVAYAAQRAESLSALFAAAAVLVALRAGRSTRPLLGGLLAAALVLLSLGAKGVGVVAFGGLALVLAAFPPGGRPDGPALWRRTLPLLLPALAFGLGLLSHVRGKADVGFSMGDLPALDAWRSQGRVVATYLRRAMGCIRLPSRPCKIHVAAQSERFTVACGARSAPWSAAASVRSRANTGAKRPLSPRRTIARSSQRML